MNANFRTYNLSVLLYRECAKIKLPHHLKDQLLRASSSIALNLAEGRGKRTPKDQRRFFDIAFGSVREVQSVLDLANAKD
ncbi:MAG: four helix bundle protein, partial [Pseudomonadota bacterium]